MSAAKHTPGPWAFDGKSRVDAVAFRRPSGVRIQDKDGSEHEVIDGLVALPYPCGDFETHAANARLIAAAPELLDVVRAFVADIDASDYASRASAAYDKALAAIAKATGEAL